MYFLIHYALHKFDIVYCKTFPTPEEAAEAMRVEVDSYFNNEVENTPQEEQGFIICTDFDDDYAALSSADGERHWTWHVVGPFNK